MPTPGLGSTRRRRLFRTLRVRDGDFCCWCKRRMIFEEAFRSSHPWAASIEHIIPRSAGGSNEKENLKLACRQCNTTRVHPEGDLQCPTPTNELPNRSSP